MGAVLSFFDAPTPAASTDPAIECYSEAEVRKVLSVRGVNVDAQCATWKSLVDVIDAATMHVGETAEVLSLPKFRVIDARPQRELFQTLFNKATSLLQGKYLNTRGISSRTLVGAKGIGKTSSLLACNSVAPWAFPGVVSMYFDFNDFTQSVFAERTVMDVVYQELHAHLLLSYSPLDRPTRVADVVRVLDAGDRRLLLLLDEFDALYETPPLTEPHAAQIALRTLAGLKAAGDESSGRLAVVLCGSSSLLQLLVQGDKSKLVTERYPLASLAQGLNGTKYQKLVIDAYVARTLLEPVGRSLAAVSDDDLELPCMAGCGAKVHPSIHPVLPMSSVGKNCFSISPR